MKKLFFDTWGWVAVAHREDDRHEAVLPVYSAYLQKKGVPVTTDYVLGETVTLLRARTGNAAFFIDTLLAAVREGRIMLERINESRWEKAWALCRKFDDKRDISFVDFTSFVVMKETGISDVLTADKHFEDIGMGFKKLF